MLVTNNTAHCFVLAAGVIIQPNASAVTVSDDRYQTDSTLNEQIDALEHQTLISITGKPADTFPGSQPAAWFQCGSSFVVSRTQGSTHIPYDSMYDNAELGNALATIPANLALEFDADTGGFTTTEDGVWLVQATLDLPADATYDGFLATNYVTAATQFGSWLLTTSRTITVVELLTLPTDTGFSVQLAYRVLPTANPYTIQNSNVYIAKVA